MHELTRTGETDAIVRREEATAPREITRTGQRYGLIALLAILAFATVALFLHYPWIAGVLGGFDLVLIIGMFASQRPNQPFHAARDADGRTEGELRRLPGKDAGEENQDPGDGWEGA